MLQCYDNICTLLEQQQSLFTYSVILIGPLKFMGPGVISPLPPSRRPWLPISVSKNAGLGKVLRYRSWFRSSWSPQCSPCLLGLKEMQKRIWNYRSISFLPSNLISKVYNREIYSRTVSFFDRNNIIAPNQFGFRKNYSTNHAILYLIIKCYDNRKDCSTVRCVQNLRTTYLAP